MSFGLHEHACTGTHNGFRPARLHRETLGLTHKILWGISDSTITAPEVSTKLILLDTDHLFLNGSRGDNPGKKIKTCVQKAEKAHLHRRQEVSLKRRTDRLFVQENVLLPLNATGQPS